ncbi:MAG TPA: SRPBCC family protein [Thermoanaerobaculia bacterium]|nr:SRPBCC family protein [Thermoanaerobaculia bacterium]
MEPKFSIQTRIRKPVAEVFDAVYNPAKLSKYFATKSASGPLDEGARVTWSWADHPHPAEVDVKKVVRDQLIVFEWQAPEGYNTRVEMQFEKLSDDQTLVRISESGWKTTKEGIESSYQNCEGWTQMSASLKAFLEYGINLRDGYY